MTSPSYDAKRTPHKQPELDELAAEIRDVKPALKTIAEELRRNRIIRTLRAMARREDRASARGKNQT